jgi:PAS domain S-box-containing protein
VGNTGLPSKFDELRRRAEEMLHERGERDAQSHGTDIFSLIHELEVHQVELQMQNEELRQARLELEKSRKEYADLYELAPIGYVTVNKKGTIVHANLMASEILRIPKKELINRGFSNFVHYEDHKAYFSLALEIARGKVTESLGEIKLLRNKSAPFYAQVEIAPSRNGSGQVTGSLIAFVDISERKRAEEELRAIPSKLIESQEKERKRLASELHDSIGQTLSALKFRIEHIIDMLRRGKAEDAAKLAEEFIPIMQRSIDETRAIYMGLRPLELEEFGVIAALFWYREEMLRLYPERHIETHISVEESQIPKHLAVPIFRVAQEALNNIAKHSRAEWVDLSLSFNGDTIELVLSDDGVGMDVDKILHSMIAKSLGMIGMRERAEMFGGDLSIESTLGEGTRVRAYWPV